MYDQAYLDLYGSAKNPDANCNYAEAVNLAALYASVGISGILGISMTGARGPTVLNFVPLSEIQPVSPWNVDPTASARYNYAYQSVSPILPDGSDIQVRNLGFNVHNLAAKDDLGRYIYTPYQISMMEWVAFTQRPDSEWTPMDQADSKSQVIGAIDASYVRP